MVDINNSYTENKNNLINTYIRNVDEYRKSIENSLLPIISYFVTLDEQQETIVELPAKIFNEQKKYLKRLSSRYHKRDFDFTVNLAKVEQVYDHITSLIRQSRKGYQYAYCDLFDFMFEQEKLFKDVNIPANMITVALEEVREFNHKIPENISVVKEKIYSPTNATTLPTILKYSSPEQLYSMVLSYVKRGIDFEILKMYDFFLENKFGTIKSDKLLEVEHRLRRVSESEYTKQGLELKLSPNNGNQDEKDLWIDEWAANVRRGIEVQDILAKSFVDYLRGIEGDDLLSLFRNGVYPELVALVDHYYNGKIPSELKLV